MLAIRSWRFLPLCHSVRRITNRPSSLSDIKTNTSSITISLISSPHPPLYTSAHPHFSGFRGSNQFLIRAFSSNPDERLPARLAQKKQILDSKTEEFTVEDLGPIPRISEEHVTVSFARSGGPGGQNVNKVNTKVDMRFNILEADWLPERIRWKLLEQEKNRINSNGELVVSSTRTRTQKDNIIDALEKIQGMIDKAAYVPPPPSEEKKKKIAKLARSENEKRLTSKKKDSKKKTDRRNKGSWD